MRLKTKLTFTIAATGQQIEVVGDDPSIDALRMLLQPMATDKVIIDGKLEDLTECLCTSNGEVLEEYVHVL